jgi:hypothetical protein
MTSAEGFYVILTLGFLIVTIAQIVGDVFANKRELKKRDEEVNDLNNPTDES